MKQDIDYFNGMSTEDLLNRFMEKLYSKTEFIQYNDPDDFFDPEQEYGNHITQCIAEERDFIRELIRSTSAKAGVILTEERIEEMVQQKREEINKRTGSAIEDYIEKVSVTYIDPVRECEQKFLLQRWLCRFWKFLKLLFTK
ncbi:MULTISPECIES: hypothetical protein [Flavobacterium]|uniref:Uncharacterized protein n=1 Tax=Flavobacterium agrisoli TaxID=2793066 RepID=A0A934PJR1_9FLAO|nr:MULTISPECIES: hypothetical protein [Flavobacterium]MBK0368649.1 hypothetical protein [Flavobacterium agrisoli]URC12007.1 hypothetical protein M4I44_18180 [Flavobacterium sp. B183]